MRLDGLSKVSEHWPATTPLEHRLNIIVEVPGKRCVHLVGEISLTVPWLYPSSYVNSCSFLRRGDLDVVSHKRRRLEDAGAAEGVRGPDKAKWIEELEKDIEDLRGEYIRHVVAVQEI